MKKTQVARLSAHVTGMVNQQILLQNEYLIAENRILRAHLPTRLRLNNPQRLTLAEIGKRLGRQALQQVASVAKPETILARYRKLIACKLMASNSAAIRDDPPWDEKLPNWSSGWLVRTAAGDTIASREP